MSHKLRVSTDDVNTYIIFVNYFFCNLSNGGSNVRNRRKTCWQTNLWSAQTFLSKASPWYVIAQYNCTFIGTYDEEASSLSCTWKKCRWGDIIDRRGRAARALFSCRFPLTLIRYFWGIIFFQPKLSHFTTSTLIFNVIYLLNIINY